MTETQKHLLIQLSWSALALALGFSALGYIGGQLTRVSSGMAKQRTLLEVMNVREITTAALRVDAKELEADRRLVQQAVPTSDDLTAVVASLESVASQSSLVQNLNFSSLGDSVVGIVPLGFQATLSGNLDNFVAYLRKLEALPYVITIGSLDLNGGTQGFASQGQFQLQGNIFVRNSPSL